jgi:hypothetical protein
LSAELGVERQHDGSRKPAFGEAAKVLLQRGDKLRSALRRKNRCWMPVERDEASYQSRVSGLPNGGFDDGGMPPVHPIEGSDAHHGLGPFHRQLADPKMNLHRVEDTD